MTANTLKTFIDRHTYDIRQSRNGRWIDQKCAPDEVHFVATCVVDYLKHTTATTFHSPDIWRSSFARTMVQNSFSKPDPQKVSATDEYNKFFRQPLKMLAAAGVLTEQKDGSSIDFGVANKWALEYIAENDWNAYEFLHLYIEKTLKDSDLWDPFESFFDMQDTHYFNKAKTAFVDFCIKYTPMRQRVEPARIFSKVLNPLACYLKKKGTAKGRISKKKILLADLKYNRENWRDAAKSKDETRQEAASGVVETTWVSHNSAKAKKEVRDYNIAVNGGHSEVVSAHSSGPATQMHHMFMEASCPAISDMHENIVALTPSQHMNLAHPLGNTSTVEPGFQRLCLLAKLQSIRANVMFNAGTPGFYDFDRFMQVLDNGFALDIFTDIGNNDFAEVQSCIDSQYA